MAAHLTSRGHLTNINALFQPVVATAAPYQRLAERGGNNAPPLLRSRYLTAESDINLSFISMRNSRLVVLIVVGHWLISFLPWGAPSPGDEHGRAQSSFLFFLVKKYVRAARRR
jgi:hypothetical protein